MIGGAVAWLMILVMYFPRWSPPPPIDVSRAQALGIPGWWRTLRWAMVPGEYFKGLGIVLSHSSAGHSSYLLGETSAQGWWYYFPAAFCFKTPVTLLLLTVLSVALAVSRPRKWTLPEIAPILGFVVYLGVSMVSRINIGIRHILPVYAFLAVWIGIQCGKAQPKLRMVALGLTGALLVVAVLAHPFYLQYFNELCGGPANGYKFLSDSNLDWGQDAKRLQRFVAEKKIHRIHADTTYTAIAANYYKVAITPTDPATARVLTNAWLVVSASRLVQPEWRWLREERIPDATLGNSTFIYRLP
jgi:hypothetical protein